MIIHNMYDIANSCKVLAICSIADINILEKRLESMITDNVIAKNSALRHAKEIKEAYHALKQVSNCINPKKSPRNFYYYIIEVCDAVRDETKWLKEQLDKFKDPTGFFHAETRKLDEEAFFLRMDSIHAQCNMRFFIRGEYDIRTRNGSIKTRLIDFLHIASMQYTEMEFSSKEIKQKFIYMLRERGCTIENNSDDNVLTIQSLPISDY